MANKNLFKRVAPVILSATVAFSSMPASAFAADFSDTEVAVETEENTDDTDVDVAEDADDADVAVEEADEDAEAVEDEASDEDVFSAGTEEEFSDDAGTEDGYKYVYAGLTWAEYWASEGVYKAGDVTSVDEVDDHGDPGDKGGFDAVTRATANHGPYRASFQAITTMVDTDGNTYGLNYFDGKFDANNNINVVLTDGRTAVFNKAKTLTVDGTTVTIAKFIMSGLKYVPVAVKAEDYEAFAAKYSVVEDGQSFSYGSSVEGNVVPHSGLVADVTADTNGLKTATKNADGTFSFSARKTGTNSGLKDQELKTANVTVTPKAADGTFGEFLRVDLNGDYGDLGGAMQAVKWEYYGNNDYSGAPIETYGTKFAADNWMHSKLGIQLGLTESVRCKLPEGYDGTGNWKVTVYALGYNDYTFTFTATKDNIVERIDPSTLDTSSLKATIEQAKALNESDYTAESWTNMTKELGEAEDMLTTIEDAIADNIKTTLHQTSLDAQIADLKSAIDDLVKVEYKYVYAGLTWAEYWASEGVYKAGDVTSVDEVDEHGDPGDKGGFDAVTRATANHGPYRASFQAITTMVDTNGNTYGLNYFDGKFDANNNINVVLTDGRTAVFNKAKTLTVDGTTVTIAKFVMSGIKYVPVAVKAEDYEAFAAKYSVVEDGQTFSYGSEVEGKVVSHSGLVADVTADTNGLKTATKNEDGTFSFSTRKTGTNSGIKDQELKTANVEVTPHAADGSFGEFLRVDLNGDYGDLGGAMQAVKWEYYGNDSSYSGDPVITYGTKFAADNWMHSKLGIQLGLTKSVRCQIPEGYDGTGYWKVTVYALGYNDYTFTFTATKDNIVDKVDPNTLDTSALKAAIAQAKALNANDYTADSWKDMTNELEECEEMLATIDDAIADKTETTLHQVSIDEQITHLTGAIEKLVKLTIAVNPTSGTLYVGDKANVTATTNISGTIAWASSNTGVATVANGVVTAKKAGTANITATVGGKTATYKVTVRNRDIAAKVAQVYVGKKATVQVTRYGVSGTAKFKSSNTKVATVSSKGVVTGKKAGTAKITVTVGKYKKVVTVKVKKPTFSLVKSSAKIKKGQKVTIKSKAAPAAKVTYKTSNKKVATVNSKGVVTAKKKGTAKITVKCNGITKTFKVTVK